MNKFVPFSDIYKAYLDAAKDVSAEMEVNFDKPEIPEEKVVPLTEADTGK